MCGILIHREDKEPPFNIDHRGIITNKIEKDGWVFGHRLLPLQTQGLSGLQPTPLGYDRYLLFNGEIFNYKDFGDYNNDLEYLMEFFSDKNWIKNPEIKKWDGFWAIVLLDKDRLYCFTDILGKKQLYYNEFGVCSEVKPLLRGLGLNSLLLGLGLGYNYFKGIKRMRPNYIYSFKIRKSGNIEREKILPTLFSPEKTDEKEINSKLKEIKKLNPDIIKIATLANGITDNLIIFNLIKK